ncbi:MAG: family 1 glycosylhydrolase [Lachnospiraceae bacterium]|nr:family 1 glycosylhydrolase [Lachnospiraceae bacterium]
MGKFPQGFMVGASTAAHQVEGNNVHSDYWLQENVEHSQFVEPSGEAVDHYHRYEEDIRLMAEAGLNAYRFSIEWARIEPKQGEFDENEIEHYRKVIACCKENGVEPVVTLHHFTSPAWVISRGGWENEEVVDWFANYVQYVVKHLGSELRYICTINEANMRLQLAAIMKKYMGQMAGGQQEEKNAPKEGDVQVGLNLDQGMNTMMLGMMECAKAFGLQDPRGIHTFVSMCTPQGDILVMKAHQAAKKVIKELYPDIKVGLTLSLHDMQPATGGEDAAHKEWEEEFSHYLPYIAEDDFLGVQSYTRQCFDEKGNKYTPEGVELTQMGYEFYPQAIANVVRAAAKEFKGDLIVTENGVATADDSRRQEYIKEATAGLQACIADGIPLKGYLHWSLMDNFEWQKGFSMQFGLIAVDRSNMKRTPKESLSLLGSMTTK